MQIKTRFITKEDYEDYTGVNLDNLLNDHNADRFIMRVENELDTYLYARLGKNLTYVLPHLTDRQKLLFKMAVIYQVDYVFHNGRIMNDSGYDPDAGKIADRNYLNRISISPITINYLQQAGIWTLHLTGGYGLFGNFGL